MKDAANDRGHWARFWLLVGAAVALQLSWGLMLGRAGSEWIGSPLLALLVCLGALRRDGWVLVALAASVLLLQPLMDRLVYGFDPSFSWMAIALPCYALFWAGGRLVRREASQAGSLSGELTRTLPMGLGAALIFYVVANTFAWIGSPVYASTAAGWIQAQTTGVPGFPPSWTFLRALIVGQLIFLPLAHVVVRLGHLRTGQQAKEVDPWVAPDKARL